MAEEGPLRRSAQVPVLVVDDTPANLLALEAVLGTPEYDVVRAGSGHEALARLAEQNFAVILLDVQMPVMDGYETAAKMNLLARQLHRPVPIILVTGLDTDPPHVLRAYEDGAVDFIQKPLVPEIIRAKVATFAALYRAKERLFLEQQRARPFRLLVESVKDYAIFLLGPQGHVTTWNAGAERIKGYRADEIVGKHFSIFYPRQDVEAGKCEMELAVAVSEGRFEEEGWRLRKDGSRFWANVTITALRDPDGKLVGFAKVTRDLTERKVAEEKLLLLAAERAALDEKARVDAFQERFIAILGHDLRNPLAAIDMGISVMRMRAEGTSDAAMTRTLEKMKSSSRRMSRMIEQILDLTRSRLTGGIVVQPAPMDLSAALTRVVEELRAAWPGRAIELRCPPVWGVWDSDRLEQVFSNLVGNAIHYGEPKKPVTIDVREEGDGIRVAMHNDGPSIPEDLQRSIFTPFRRGERESRKAQTAGLGLGLYISREIVLAHGGEITVRSHAGEGTTFDVTLPRDSRKSSSK